MIGSSSGSTVKAADTLLALISDPEGARKRLEELKSAGKKHDQAKASALRAIETSKQAALDADERLKKALVAEGNLEKKRLSMAEEAEKSAAVGKTREIQKTAEDKRLSDLRKALNIQEASLKDRESALETSMSAIGAREKRAEDLTAQAKDIIEAAGLLGKKKLA